MPACSRATPELVQCRFGPKWCRSSIAMNLIWLEDFLALAASGNFSRAAEQRHVTQPAFGRRIRALEDWLGTPLFERGSQPARLTEVGLWFRDVAEDMLARVQRLPDDARAMADANANTLRIASTHALSLTFLPAWLRGVEERRGAPSATRVQLMSDVLAQCETLLLQGRVQFVLCHAHARSPSALDDAGCLSVAVGRDDLVPVSAADAQGNARHDLGRHRAGTDTLPLLTYSDESGLGRLLQPLLAAVTARRACETVFTAHLATVLRSMALEGRGLAWLPRSLVAEDIAGGRLALASDDVAYTTAMDVRLYRPARPDSPMAEQFWKAASQMREG